MSSEEACHCFALKSHQVVCHSSAFAFHPLSTGSVLPNFISMVIQVQHSLSLVYSSRFLVRSQNEFANILRKSSLKASFHGRKRWESLVRPRTKKAAGVSEPECWACTFTSLTDGHVECGASRWSPDSDFIASDLGYWSCTSACTYLSPVRHRAQPFPAAFAYITVGSTNYPVIVPLINEPLMRLITVVNWLGPSALIPP